MSIFSHFPQSTCRLDLYFLQLRGRCACVRVCEWVRVRARKRPFSWSRSRHGCWSSVCTATCGMSCTTSWSWSANSRAAWSWSTPERDSWRSKETASTHETQMRCLHIHHLTTLHIDHTANAGHFEDRFKNCTVPVSFAVRRTPSAVHFQLKPVDTKWAF